MLSDEPPRQLRSQPVADEAQPEYQRAHQYSTRQSIMSNAYQPDDRQTAPQSAHVYETGLQNNSRGYNNPAPMQQPPKNVAFELLFDGHSNEKARLPMRVRIYPHDTTDSIVSTVRDFYGLYAGVAKGISFEDSTGMTLIARYENFSSNMIVYVRVIPDYSQSWQQSPTRAENHAIPPDHPQRTPHLDAGFEMVPTQPTQALNYGPPYSRPSSRMSRKQSASPGTGDNRRSGSAQKERSRSSVKTHGDNFQAHLDGYNHEALKYGSSDEEGGSVTSSRKARNEQLASAEISEKNIVEGGRRQAQRAKFESSVGLARWIVITVLANERSQTRNFPFSCLHRSQLPIRSLQSLHSDVQTVKITHRHSLVRLSDHSVIASHCSLHKATALQIIPTQYLQPTTGQQKHSQASMATAFATVSVRQAPLPVYHLVQAMVSILKQQVLVSFRLLIRQLLAASPMRTLPCNSCVSAMYPISRHTVALLPRLWMTR